MPIITNQQQPNAMQNTATPEGRRQKGTGFTNIRNLLQANVGAGGVMGAGLASGLGQKAGQLSRDVQTAGQQFGQQYQQQKEKTLGQGGSVAGISGYLTGGQDVSGLSEEEAKKLGTGLAEAQYTGPTELANQQSLLGRAGNVQALSTLAGMGGIGQGRLLQGSATRRGAYTRGQGLLDQYLVGQDVGAQQAIKAASAEAAGAAQQAQTSADVAAQQAEGLKTSIEAQKEQTKQDVLKALAGSQESATQSAKQYLQQAARIKGLLSGDIPIDQQNEDDIALMNDLAAYGLDEFTVNTMDQSVIDGIINKLASGPATEYTGQQRYGTEAEQRAARNLALISGQGDVAQKIASTSFDPNLFSSINKDIALINKKSSDDTKSLENTTGVTNLNQAESLVGEYNKALSLKDSNRYGSTENYDASRGISDLKDRIDDNQIDPTSFMGRALKILGADAFKRTVDEIDKFGGSDEYLNNLVANSLEEQIRNKLSPIQNLRDRYKSTTSLQDYIKKKFSTDKQAREQSLRADNTGINSPEYQSLNKQIYDSLPFGFKAAYDPTADYSQTAQFFINNASGYNNRDLSGLPGTSFSSNNLADFKSPGQPTVLLDKFRKFLEQRKQFSF
jgi:hypothetical protein